MKTESEWTAWGDDHPFLAGFMQVGIYLLCWVGVIAGVWIILAGIAFLVVMLGGD